MNFWSECFFIDGSWEGRRLSVKILQKTLNRKMRLKWFPIRPNFVRNRFWSEYALKSTWSKHPRRKWPLTIPKSDIVQTLVPLKPITRPCNFSLETQRVRSTWVSFWHLPSGTSTWTCSDTTKIKEKLVIWAADRKTLTRVLHCNKIFKMYLCVQTLKM